MNKIKKLLVVVAAFIPLTAAVLFLSGTFQGCKVPTLAPGGVYSVTNGGGAFLFATDESLVQSKATLTAFLSWCQDNRALLASNNMSVLVAAEKIRTNAPLWFTNAYTLRTGFLVALSRQDPVAIVEQSNQLSAAVSSIEANASSTTALRNNVK